MTNKLYLLFGLTLFYWCNYFRDVKKVKETQRVFERISGDLDNALTKNAQTVRAKTAECEEAHNVLTATRSAFGHTALDYVFQVSDWKQGLFCTLLLCFN